VYDRGNSGVSGKRWCKRKENDGEMWEQGERKQVLDGRRGKKVKREERGEILNVDGREIRWMKEIWKRGERTEKETGGA
jgi:hypothetical protein